MQLGCTQPEIYRRLIGTARRANDHYHDREVSTSTNLGAIISGAKLDGSVQKPTFPEVAAHQENGEGYQTVRSLSQSQYPKEVSAMVAKLKSIVRQRDADDLQVSWIPGLYFHSPKAAVTDDSQSTGDFRNTRKNQTYGNILTACSESPRLT